MLLLKNGFIFNRILVINSSLQHFNVQERWVSYVQGQKPKPNIREYFYFIDHQGMVSKYYCQLVFFCKLRSNI